MRKAKVVAIVCGMIASCLFGGFAVVEAATITLDDSSADLVVYVQPTTDDYEPQETAVATTVTSIATTTTAESRITTVNYAGAVVRNVNAQTTTETVKATEPVEEVTETEAPETTEATPKIAKNQAAHVTTVQTTKTTETTTTTTTTTVATTLPATEAPTTNAPAVPQTMPLTAAQDVTNPPMPTEAELVLMSLETTPFEIPEPTMLEVPTEMPTEAPVDAAPVQPDSNAVSVSESDYILLCNAVAHEAGANSISIEDKAKVVEVIMNRVNSSKYPNSIYGVLTQKYQFTGSSTYTDLGSFSGKVTDMVREAVGMYLSDPTQFSEGYLSFHGDGVRNYFK